MTDVQQPRWQALLAEGVASIPELLTLLELETTQLNTSIDATHQFPLRVPRGFIARMKKGDVNDPLLRQILPVPEELQAHPAYSFDPLQELSANPLPGLLHKYEGRVLITLTGACAINCRYCFRRHFPYAENNPAKENWRDILDYISNDSSIKEVILSGGEPLLLNDHQLKQRIAQIAQIPHVDYLRIHTRMPIVLPERITPDLISCLSETRLNVVMVVHSNHANELDFSVEKAIKFLRQAGITVLNQAVLLKGVNDNEEALVNLSHALFRLGVIFYYLHYPDKVQGTQHFTIDMKEAQSLMRRLSARLPGYLVPKFVVEKSGEAGKVLVDF